MNFPTNISDGELLQLAYGQGCKTSLERVLLARFENLLAQHERAVRDLANAQAFIHDLQGEIIDLRVLVPDPTFED